MTVKNRLWDTLFCFVTGVLYAYALSYSAIANTFLQVPPVMLLSLCVLSVLLFCIIFFNRYTTTVCFVFLLAIGLIVYISLRRQDFEARWYMELMRYSEELLQLTSDKVPYREEYNLIVGGGAAALFSLAAVLLMRLNYSIFMLTLLAVIVFSIPFYMGWEIAGVSVLLFALCFVLLIVKKLSVTAAPKGDPGVGAGYALALIPVCVLVFAAAFFAPKPDFFADDARGGIIDSADRLISDMSQSQVVSFTNENSRLGGPVILNDFTVMEVTADERVYLRGTVRDIYTGSSWKASDTEQSELVPDNNGWYFSGDDTDGLYSTQEYYARYYGRPSKTISINTLSLRPTTVYTPPFRAFLWISDDNAEPVQNYFGAVTAKQPLASGTGYTQEYTSWDFEDSYFINILQSMAAETVDEDAVKAGMGQYLQLPDTLPQRVAGLARSLTEGLPSDYEKVKALEKYLAAFPYTLTPANVPQNRDFVDYFLFDGQEGYCVYYASAMVVMARSIGIPARYAEGFVMPPRRNENGSYTVTNEQAHAWAEIFYPGFGWVYSEATAPYYGGLAEQPREQERPVPLPQPEPEPEQETATAPVGTEQEPESAAGKLPVIMLAMLAVGVLSAFALYYVTISRRKAKLQKIDSLPNKQAAAAWFTQLVRAAGAKGYPIKTGETAFVYADRLNETLVFEREPVRLFDLAEIFSKAAYSKNEITDSERHVMKSCYHEIASKKRGKRGISGG